MSMISDFPCQSRTSGNPWSDTTSGECRFLNYGAFPKIIMALEKMVGWILAGAGMATKGGEVS